MKFRASMRCCPTMVAFAMAGCATHTYAGVDLEPGAAPPEIQSLARDAQVGDKRAQFQLGLRFEEGQSVRRDLAAAVRLYRAAGSDSGGIMPIWSPAVGNTPGRIILVSLGPRIPGLPAARQRLMAIEGATREAARSRVSRQHTTPDRPVR